MRYYTLDAMRGVAAIAVVILHIVLQFELRPKPSSFMGVDFFFMLSGFVLATVYEDRLKRDLNAGAFFLLRVVRLYPMYFLGMSLGTVTLIGQDMAQSGHSLNITQSVSAIVAGFLVMPDPLSSGLFPLNPPAWSLFFEALINIAFALVVIRLSTRILFILTLAFGIAYIAGAIAISQMSAGMAWNSIGIGLIRVAFTFGVGVLFARWRPKESIKRPGSGIILCCALFLILMVPQFAFQPTAYNLLATMVFMPVLLWFGIRWQLSGLAAMVAEALGDMSYPLYAMHYPFMRMTSFASKALHVPPLIFGVVFLIGACLGSLAIARFIDPPLRQSLCSKFARLEKFCALRPCL